MKKNISISLVLVALQIFTLKSQVSNYVFSQFSGTYTAITGGTVFGTTTSDDQVFVDPNVPLGGVSGATGVGIPIGFSFVYNNLSFDRLGINNNGWIFLGQSTSIPAVNSQNSSGYIGISGNSTAPANLQNRVAGISRDLQAQAGANLRVETIGVSPNQICVVQWSNYRKFAATGDSYNFQIRLYETSNEVEVVYGPFTNNATTTTSEVGLRGSSNADFNNRSVNTSLSWATSIAGLTSNATAALNGTGLVPSNGQIYKWIPPAPCSGTPSANSVVSSQSLICPNANVVLSLSNTYTNVGITYQWFSSTLSPVGPFTAIPGATLTTLTATNVQSNTYYQAGITCTVSSATVSANVQAVNIATTIVDNVPYFEGFEGVSITNQLPNCSWLATSPSLICQTYTTAAGNNRIPHTGTKFASFRFGTNSNGDYFYSNGLQLQSGVTYSAAVWYITDGLIGWSDLSLMLGQTQSTTALTNIASVNGMVTGQFYQALTNTFVVSSSGIYYLAIKCIGNSATQFLTFDDLSVTIPCSLNSPSISISPVTTTLCSGNSLTLNVTGAASYTWNTGLTDTSIVVTPNVSSLFTVIGLNPNTNCSSTASVGLTVYPTPILNIFTPTQAICSGSSTNLYGFGVNSFTWSVGSNSASIVVSPTVNTTYTLTGTNSNNSCPGFATQLITVNPLPVFSIESSKVDPLCVGETATLSTTGQALTSYVWSNNSVTYISPQIIINPTITTNYTLVASDLNGCSATEVFTQNVSVCSGIDANTGTQKIVSVYPNPNTGKFNIATSDSDEKLIEILDISGRVVYHAKHNSSKTEIDISDLKNGVYFVKLLLEGDIKIIKVIKQD